MNNVSLNIKIDRSKWDKIAAAFADKKVVKVGILGSKVSREGDPINNAELGLIQEFGSAKRNIPPRSFLRMPLENAGDTITEVGSKASFQKAIEGGDTTTALSIIGAVAQGIVTDAFVSGGDGQWPANKPATIARKKSSKPLIDTGQLRRSIDFEVADGNKT